MFVVGFEKYMYNVIECMMAVQNHGHPRPLLVVSFESAYVYTALYHFGDTVGGGLKVENRQFIQTPLSFKDVTGAPNARGVAKTSNFRPICGYISERVLDRGIVTIEDEYEVVCALSNSATFDDFD